MNQLVQLMSDILDEGSLHQEYILHFIWKTSSTSRFIKLKTTDKASVVPFNAVSGFKRICSLSETQRHGTLISIQTLDNLTTWKCYNFVGKKLRTLSYRHDHYVSWTGNGGMGFHSPFICRKFFFLKATRTFKQTSKQFINNVIYK